jgi:hypothetical protein
MRDCSRFELEEVCAPGRRGRDAVIRFQIGASFDRHVLKSGSEVEMKYLETAQRLQEGVLKKCHDEIVST